MRSLADLPNVDAAVLNGSLLLAVTVGTRIGVEERVCDDEEDVPVDGVGRVSGVYVTSPSRIFVIVTSIFLVFAVPTNKHDLISLIQ